MVFPKPKAEYIKTLMAYEEPVSAHKVRSDEILAGKSLSTCACLSGEAKIAPPEMLLVARVVCDGVAHMVQCEGGRPALPEVLAAVRLVPHRVALIDHHKAHLADQEYPIVPDVGPWRMVARDGTRTLFHTVGKVETGSGDV